MKNPSATVYVAGRENGRNVTATIVSRPDRQDSGRHDDTFDVRTIDPPTPTKPPFEPPPPDDDVGEPPRRRDPPRRLNVPVHRALWGPLRALHDALVEELVSWPQADRHAAEAEPLVVAIGHLRMAMRQLDLALPESERDSWHPQSSEARFDALADDPQITVRDLGDMEIDVREAD